MRTLLTLAAAICLIALSFGVTAPKGDTVNSKCPVSGMPVVEGKVVEAKGGSIGVCCGKCQTAVAAWDDEKKAKFVAQQVGAVKEEKKAETKATWTGDPYLLSVCAASGRPIDVKGTPTTKVVDGRELKFCCGGCADVVAKDPAKWLVKVDEKQTAAQMAFYPTDTCIISGEPLMEKGDDGKMKDIGTNVVVHNRLFRVCCKMCAKKLKSDPGTYGVKLDRMAAEAQAKDYPFENCVVNTKGKLDAKAKVVMLGGRMVKTCCGHCEETVRAEPAKYVAMVEAARRKAGARAKGADAVEGAKKEVKKVNKEATKALKRAKKTVGGGV